jgi:hypothetical protein
VSLVVRSSDGSHTTVIQLRIKSNHVPTATRTVVASAMAPRRGSRSGTVSYRKSQQVSIFLCLLFCGGWVRSRLPSLRQLYLQHFGSLQLHGSRADIVVLIQMKATSNHSSLPREKLQWLTCMNIRTNTFQSRHRRTSCALCWTRCDAYHRRTMPTKIISSLLMTAPLGLFQFRVLGLI